jgi:hypothetical protein
MAIWSFVLVIVLGPFIALGALIGIPLAFVSRSRIAKSGGTLQGSGLALAAIIVGFAWVTLFLFAIAIPVFLGVTHSGPSLQNLDADVQRQITGTGPGEFNVAGVTSVNCQPPARWTTGSTFTCVVYGSGGSVAGNFYGTVTTNAANGDYQWYGRYTPTGFG